MPRAKYTPLEKLHLLEKFKTAGQGIRTFVRLNGLTCSALQSWQLLYEREGIAGLEETSTNQHYPKELRSSSVLAYLNGEGSMSELAMKFALRLLAQLSHWVAMYSEDNQLLTALPSRKQVPTMRRKITFERRIEVVEYVTKAKHSYTEAAAHFENRLRLGPSKPMKAVMKRWKIIVAIAKTTVT